LPVLELEPLPMFGQFLVEPLPEPELAPEPVELDEPELVLLDPLDPVLEVLALDPVVPVVDVVAVVAASATSAPPATSPVVSAPIANTLRSRIFMVVAFRSCVAPTRSGWHAHRAPWICGQAQGGRSAMVGFTDDWVTIHSWRRAPQPAWGADSVGAARAHRMARVISHLGSGVGHRAGVVQCLSARQQ
jgi:hypothetical protein